MKQCKTCGELKSLDQYSNSKKNAGGKRPHCKSCAKTLVNKDSTKAASKRYRDRYPEKRLEQNRKYREQNPEKMRKINTNYSNMRYRTDSVYRLQTILRQQIVDYIKYKKSERTSQLLGYTAEDFIARYGEGGPNQHIDHKIPKSWFRDDTPINIVWSLDNLQWLTVEENCSKHNNHMTPVTEDYLQTALQYIREEYVDKLNTDYL